MIREQYCSFATALLRLLALWRIKAGRSSISPFSPAVVMNQLASSSPWLYKAWTWSRRTQGAGEAHTGTRRSSESRRDFAKTGAASAEGQQREGWPQQHGGAALAGQTHRYSNCREVGKNLHDDIKGAPVCGEHHETGRGSLKPRARANRHCAWRTRSTARIETNCLPRGYELTGMAAGDHIQKISSFDSREPVHDGS